MKASDYSAKLAQLRDDPTTLPWNERLALVEQTAAALMGGRRSSPNAVALLRLLADDAKWEVRKAVADQLHLLGEDDFHSFAAVLSEDHNSYVKAAAERAISRRLRGQRTTTRRMRGLDRAEHEIERIERTKGAKTAQVVRDVAHRLYEGLVGASVHEMRSVITAMKGNVEQLQGDARRGGGAEAALKIAPRLAQQVAFLEKLLGDMRMFTQVLPKVRHTERIADLVHEATAMVQAEFAASGRDASSIDLVVEVPEHLSACVSRLQIVIALRNLIKNAHEAFMVDAETFASGRVRVSACAQDADWIEIRVEDNGMGLDDRELADVRQFIPGRTSKSQLGTGFGLPIAHRNVTEHGGTLQIASTDEAGTTATINLPIEPKDPS